MRRWNRDGLRAGIVGAALVAAGVALAAHHETPAYERAASPENARLYFISPADGETLDSPVTIRFGLSGMGVAPSGVARDKTGHHHLLVDTDLPALDAPIPADANHVHFGGGQSEATVELEAGTHTLQLLLGDANHVPHDPPVASERIAITVR